MASTATPAPSPRIVVVGGGIIGLTSALALLERGFTDVRILADSFDDTTSHVAGAIWLPFALPENMSVEQSTKWCEVSMAWLTKLHEAHGEACGIHFVDGVDMTAEEKPTGPIPMPYWAHCVQNFRELSSAEVSAVDSSLTHGVAFRTVIYTPKVLMAWLHEEIRNRGGVCEQRHVDSVDDIDCDVLVNCTGLDAKTFVHDDSVFPIRGQVIRVRNPEIKEFIMVVDCDGAHSYILPRPGHEVIVGGTVQPHNWKRENDADDVAGIWARATALCPTLSKSEVLGQHCGLRPQRTNGVRLEVDAQRSSHGAVVVHNYGHAGSGHTLQWGCAQDAVNLVLEHFPRPNSS